jgi:manganese-dependent inorganic pyrophosphatase
MIYIFGHKNPDSDSVSSAIALSELKAQQGHDVRPFVLGEINKESEFILDKFNIDRPEILKEVSVQVCDLQYDTPTPINLNKSILSAHRLMESENIRTLPVVENSNKLVGILTMKDIAMNFINGDNWYINTSLSNIIESFNASVIVPYIGRDGGLDDDPTITGKVLVIAFYYKTLKKHALIGSDTIAIVGNNYETIQLAIEKKVNLIILTGGINIPEEYIHNARKAGVPIISVPDDTYETARQITLCNFVSSIMKSEKIVRFKPNYSLDDVKEDLSMYKFTNYPVLASGRQYLGMLNRNHIISPMRKKVILVDHNEYGQSVEGLCEAEILEIIDHHKLGDISTSTPISFRNYPVGSTCTIIYLMYKESNIEIPKNIAGILISGIISDTMLFKSPTTTPIDRTAVDELNSILELDIDEYAHEMFRAGSSLEGESIEHIFSKDYKDFEIDSTKVGISQIFTLNIENVVERKEELLNYLNTFHIMNGNELTLIAITDILSEGSYILYASDNQMLIRRILGVNLKQGCFLNGVVSRKKQLLPLISESISALKNM